MIPPWTRAESSGHSSIICRPSPRVVEGVRKIPSKHVRYRYSLPVPGGNTYLPGTLISVAFSACAGLKLEPVRFITELDVGDHRDILSRRKVGSCCPSPTSPGTGGLGRCLTVGKGILLHGHAVSMLAFVNTIN